MIRKIWVKRPGASATRVEVDEEDLVDAARDVILRKYANSLGRSIDSPDVTLKIIAREQGNRNIPVERVLGPEEHIGHTLDAYYPGGQNIDEALVIEVPQRRTPKPSPRPGNHHISYYLPDDYRPGDGAREYFPPMPLHSPHMTHAPHTSIPNPQLPMHSVSVLTTGQLPPLSSPGNHSARRHPRPKYGRQHTSSPTIVQSSQPPNIDPKVQLGVAVPSAPPLPTPPVGVDHKPNGISGLNTASPHPNRLRKRKATIAPDVSVNPPLPSKPASAALLDGKVPPINVLIVEDNPINLRLLEQFMRRLKVRSSSAMNGREAVDTWRKGGFHLVLMDIQLPVMNGLDATKEIRRLESANGIGISVFEDTTPGEQGDRQLREEDILKDRNLFKSPVIIVALTASSLQSDRHEALAVGCNDFLTKPVSFPWMERKVTEWGCMQALIDFDGWRKWVEIEKNKENMDPEKRKQEEKDAKAKAKADLKAMFAKPPPLNMSTSTTTPAAKKDNKSTTTKPSNSADNTTSITTTFNGKRKDESNESSPQITNGFVTSPVSITNGGGGHETINGALNDNKIAATSNTNNKRHHRGSRGSSSRKLSPQSEPTVPEEDENEIQHDEEQKQKEKEKSDQHVKSVVDPSSSPPPVTTTNTATVST